MTEDYTRELDHLAVELRLYRKAVRVNQNQAAQRLNALYEEGRGADDATPGSATQSRVSKFETGMDAYLFTRMKPEILAYVDELRGTPDILVQEGVIEREAAARHEARMALTVAASEEARRRRPLISLLHSLMAGAEDSEETLQMLEALATPALIRLYKAYTDTGENSDDTAISSA